MALIARENKRKKENSKESFNTNFNKPFVCMFLTTLLQRYIIPTCIKFSNFIEQNLLNVL